jgi:hypothetical protein
MHGATIKVIIIVVVEKAVLNLAAFPSAHNLSTEKWK